MSFHINIAEFIRKIQPNLRFCVTITRHTTLSRQTSCICGSIRDGMFSLVLACVKLTLGALGYELVEHNIRGMLQVEEY